MNEYILFNTEINISGLLVGVYSFVNIIVARKICIIGEYYFSKKIWIAFLIFGLICILFSLFCDSIIVSTILGITGFTYLWGIHEVIEQEERVNKGWYPKNPKRTKL
jgi:hypothetical protein